jgi:hypothetical protein
MNMGTAIFSSLFRDIDLAPEKIVDEMVGYAPGVDDRRLSRRRLQRQPV